ncbi:Putative O-methyltransferase domain, FAD-binding domain, O-methyltransferase COMT-type [Septoria linicola]|uniref:O-methyltransferase domain, FAD-binding domain, O-methyltransferase COMT-type n=1 Tax=Septoria linicola TaxID=215465 RepID=A0A9Q9EFR1_9PEZI|nr:putative O-methyltransferase domain, FAD-binding domain, O-methyltransferase COMT-type [Septoria linicola]USW47942.1 Putative O-methyltransferase domain, FAD-binding domain, O-methyltransferase COMT-type [Septoria linicola]
MDFQRDLETSLEAIASNANAVLAYLKAQPGPGASQSKLPQDPLEGCDVDIQASRRRLTEASAKLLQLSTRPQEYLEHLQNGYQNLTCIRWLVDLDVLTHVPEKGTISYVDLASKANVPPMQLRGIARMAICNGFLEEPEVNQLRHSRISALFARDESYLSWARWMVNYSVPTALQLNNATRQWGETVAKDQTAFNLGMDVKVPFFDHLRQTPDMKDAFAGYMRNVTSNETWGLQHAVTGFDWASLPEGAKVVDVGGSLGHGSLAIAKQHTHLSFVVQDLPETIAGARKELAEQQSLDSSIESRIKFMEHDFFGPQPVHDADVYFLRMICHDWPDNEAQKILSHIRAAMKPSAKIVIMDTILPQPGTISVLQEQQLRIRDLTMMQVFNAKERELEDWNLLMKSSGLKVSHVNQPLNSVMGLLTVCASGPVALTRTNTLQPELLAGVPAGSNTTESKPVLIMGAGIAGLCLGQGLKKAGIDFRIFERDPSMDSRPQGYRLKLEPDAAKSLRECLPEYVYQAFESSCAITAVGETDFNPFNGNIVHSRAGGGLSGKQGLYATFTVDRKAFRTQLMTGIEDKISFGKELAYYKIDSEQSVVTAEFKDGTNAQGAFLTGADGLHSVVRKTCVPDNRLVDTGAVCIYGKTVMSPEILARFPEKGLRWMTVASDSAPMLQSCLIGESPITLLLEPIRFSEAARARHPQLPADYIYWALIGRKERFGSPEMTSTKSFVSPEQAADQAAKLSLAVTEEWHPSLRALFELQDVKQASLIRVASTVPEIAPWQTHTNVTVLGDAIHPMSPCGGVGANTALVDAHSLAKVLQEHNSKPSVNAIAGFEADMRQRALRSILRSEIGSKKMFGQKNLVDCPEFKV